MIRGFDASSVQGRLDFKSLDPALRFVILKAQQGNDGFDPTFHANHDAALEAGLVPFAYCFAYPLPHLDPKEQAALFVERTKVVGRRPLFLDFEWPAPEEWSKWKCTASQISEWCRVCAEEVERLMGVAPVIYTYPYWWASVSKADVSWAARVRLWLAAYVTGWPKSGDSPKVPKPWTSWLFWQFDGNGGLRLPNGIDADFCVFNGTEEDLQALVVPWAAPDFDTVHPSPFGEA